MKTDTLILGAGAAGLMCAAHAGRRCLVLDHARAAGEKIRISGGGRCNFTNLHAGPENFLSGNSHFCKSALSRYSQWDFLDLVQRYGIAWHEKTLGQLFCDGSAKDIVAMLLAEARTAGAEIWLEAQIAEITRTDGWFRVQVNRNGHAETVEARNLVVATGGKSIPKMGATGLAYRIAEQFDVPVSETRPGLVPLTFSGTALDRLKPLAGLSVPVEITCNGTQFREALLFTHRGVSGPAILQISSFWRDGDSLSVRLCPDVSFYEALRARRPVDGRKAIATHLGAHLPARLAALVAQESGCQGNLADQSDKALRALVDQIEDWKITPSGSEGYRTAEVTLGGIDTAALSSRSMEVQAVPGLHFIGEGVDVTGWLGGYNFQWAWSSGWAAGVAIAERNRR